jgi:seryl-tRNA synthetase
VVELSYDVPVQEGELVKEGPKRAAKPVQDLDALLFKERMIDHYAGRESGLFIILPEGQRLFEVLKGLVEERIGRALGYIPITLPKISPVDTFRKANILGKWDGYLERVQPFSATNGVKEDYLMEPLQCTPLYQYLEGRVLDASDGPLKLYDASGPTYRNEDTEEISPLIKQREFHRSEFMYLGTKEQVISSREETLAKLEDLCDSLSMQYRIVVGSGCYQISDDDILFPKTAEEISIKDLEVHIPAGFDKRGERMHHLEVAGAAALGDIQAKRFNICASDGGHLWSGCVGVGLERLMYAFLAHHGFDKAAWPEIVKDKYERAYEGMEAARWL